MDKEKREGRGKVREKRIKEKRRDEGREERYSNNK